MAGQPKTMVRTLKPSLAYRIRKSLARDWDLYLLLLPGVVWFLMFAYKPMAGLRMAF